jgi:hypothetical protein
MRVRAGLPFANARFQGFKAGIAGNVSDNDLGICEAAYDMFHAGLSSVGDGGPEQKVPLATIARTQCFEGRQQDDVFGRAVALAVRLQEVIEGRGHQLRFDVPGKAASRFPGVVGGEIQGREIALDMLTPEIKGLRSTGAVQVLGLPDREICELERQFWKIGTGAMR